MLPWLPVGRLPWLLWWGVPPDMWLVGVLPGESSSSQSVGRSGDTITRGLTWLYQ